MLSEAGEKARGMGGVDAAERYAAHEIAQNVFEKGRRACVASPST
jgi:hypothetical protein